MSSSVALKGHRSGHFSEGKGSKKDVVHTIRRLNELKKDAIITDAQLNSLSAFIIALYVEKLIEEKVEKSFSSKFDDLFFKKLANG